MTNLSPSDSNTMEEKPIYLERTRLKLQLAKDVHDKFEVKMCNEDFIIYPNVFNPNIFFGTEFLAEQFIKIISEFHAKPPTFLEIGTGAGYMSVLAILNGASRGTCTDINNDALRNVEENVIKHNLTDRMTIKYSDVFSGINTREKFDIILWNYPFGHINKSVEELEILERALMDPFYKSLDMYLKNAHEYLNPDRGRLFLGFSNTAGYQQSFENIAKKYNWSVHLRNEIKSETTPIMQMGMYELIKIQ
jgi:methylase of polypeptide subunit release factors